MKTPTLAGHDLLNLLKPSLKPLIIECLQEMLSELTGSTLPPKADKNTNINSTRITPKLLTFTKRCEIAWLLMNTTYSKRAISKMYHIHETTIASRKLRAADVWMKALQYPSAPPHLHIPKKYIKQPALTMEEVLDS